MQLPLAGLVDLDRTNALPLHRQLYHQLRAAILAGKFRSGERLPSSRAMSQALGVSRNTVVDAVSQLKAEGFVASHVGAGTCIVGLPEEALVRPKSRIRQIPTPKSGPSARGRRLAMVRRRAPQGSRPAFTPGLPAVDLFPHGFWARLLGRHARHPRAEVLGYAQSCGLPALREVLVEYLADSRGVHSRPHQIFIVSSAQAAFDILARVVLDPGDPAWIEEPGYLGVRAALIGAGARLVPVPVDRHGLIPDTMQPPARVIYVSPSHQYPTGATLSLSRRLSLLELASAMHAYVIEDDYDSEFRYGERPIAALQGLDESDSVIYVGTFAKTMFPAIRAAYLVAPPALVDTLEMALRNTGHLVPVVLQAALADFIREGHLASHLRHMRMVYGERRKALVENLTKFADSRVTLLPAHGGMQLCALLHDVQDDRRLVSLLAESGVNAAPLSEFYLGRPRSGLVLGFAGPDLTEINAGVRIIADAIDRMRSPG